ncbi:MAG: lysoplasmalogenase [Pseudomonadales bacterium]
MEILFSMICAACCAALVISEYKSSRRGVVLFKPLASAAFVAVGLSAGQASDSNYMYCILLGLCASWLGDVLLIPAERAPFFLAGITCFLAAHLAYCAAFLTTGFSLAGFAFATLFMLPLSLFVLRWLRPHLADGFRYAVPLYIGVITIMVLLAGSATMITGRPVFVIGAALFAISDVAVARDRFVMRGFVNRAWGLPLYYAAQLLLALSIVLF